MRRAIVHIGTPRSGTTTLQRILFTQRQALARCGILYPDITPRSAPAAHLSHQHLGEALDGRRSAADRRELLGRLDEQLRETPCDVVLLSYEALCQAPEHRRVPQTLADQFARHGFALEVLLTVKPQADFLNSTYTWRNQFLREAGDFATYAHAALGERRFDYARLVQQWRRPSADRLIAVPVRDRTDVRPLVQRVFDGCGLLDRIDGLLIPADLALVENRSPGPVAVEVNRRLRLDHLHRALGAAGREATRYVEQAAQQRGLDRLPFNGVANDFRQAVEARWCRSNAAFAALVWQSEFAARAEDGPPRPRNEIAGGCSPLNGDIEAIIAEVRAAFGLTRHWSSRVAASLAAARHLATSAG